MSHEGDTDDDVDFDAVFDAHFFSVPTTLPPASVAVPSSRGSRTDYNPFDDDEAGLTGASVDTIPRASLAPAKEVVLAPVNPFDHLSSNVDPALPELPVKSTSLALHEIDAFDLSTSNTTANPPTRRHTTLPARDRSVKPASPPRPEGSQTAESLIADEKDGWTHLANSNIILDTVPEEASPSPTNLRGARKSVPVGGVKSLGEPQRRALWQTLHSSEGVAALSIAPVKRVSFPLSHIVHDPPRKTGEDPTLLHTLDQKLASFASYLGETKTLKAELEAAHLAAAAYEAKVQALEATVATMAAQEVELRQYISALEAKVESAATATDALEQQRNCLAEQRDHWTIQLRNLGCRTLRRFLRQSEGSAVQTCWRRWQSHTHRLLQQRALATSKVAMILLGHAEKRHQLDRGLHCLRSSGQLQAGEHRAAMATTMVGEYRRYARETSLRCLLLMLETYQGSWRERALQQGFRRWHTTVTVVASMGKRRGDAIHRLARWHQLRCNDTTRRALHRWHHVAQFHELSAAVVAAARREAELREAKEYVFDLSRQKAKVEETARVLASEVRDARDTIVQLQGELTLNKHGFVAYVVRRLDCDTGVRPWLRRWQDAVALSKATRALDARVVNLEAALDDQTKFAKSLDQYNKVLQADVERFQFVTHDTRIAVEALTKKLLREESRARDAAVTAEALSARIAALTVVGSTSSWALPEALVLVGKELVVDRLTTLFSIHADAPQHEAWTPQMSFDSCYELVQSTLAASTPVTDTLDVLAHLASFFPDPPLTLPVFVHGLHEFLGQMLQQAHGATLQARLEGFWRLLLTTDDRMETPTGSWAKKNQLSDDILQNQEKLLAVLEHETAVVERAVLEKASLKHTYPGDAAPVEPDEDAMAWLDLPQVRDLIAAYQAPLVALYAKYATHHCNSLPLPAPHWSPLERQLHLALQATQPHAVTMHLQGALKLFEDLKIVPAVFAPDVIAGIFAQVTVLERPGDDKVLSCYGFVKLFGACILHTYMGRPSPMSIREKLHTFFFELDLHRLPLGAANGFRNPKPCYVGPEVEAVLWPLFDYFATGGDRPSTNDEPRISLTLAKFCRFMTEIAGVDKDVCRADGELMFRKAVRVSRGGALSSRMVFDEFYLGIYYMHQLRDTTRRYDSPGEALQEWMAQL
ncbi:hypothetical protein ACHHYP_03795 [Achlya hypogyna]|uniref:Uncharacterized protein n=1 Tax=Achlya hypogyna TaxID=1202772 RepID=A0A1V9Z2X2_ACHHY|nr:hypothetical protein ACHHYP_03795 [Achlya hypogyna]